jgi:hypothetical protein
MNVRLILGLTLFLAACSSSSVETHASFDPRPPDWPIDVIYGTTMPADIMNSYRAGYLGVPPKNAVPVADLQFEKYVSTGWREVIKDAVQQARSLGGDGILIEHERLSMLGGDRLHVFVFRKKGKR